MSGIRREMGDRATRRGFLRRSAVVAPCLALAFPGWSWAAKSAKKPPRLPELYPGQNQRSFHEILGDEVGHVQILKELLDDEDNPLNPKIRAMPRLRNLVQPNVWAFVEAAASFENTGSGTYAGALFATQQTTEYFPTAAGITTVEARHAAFLNSLLNDALVPSFVPVESPIDQTVTLSRVAPFIADLNGSKPEFDPASSSDANNFAILDFLLLLEYVEASFYMANVPRFFG